MIDAHLHLTHNGRSVEETITHIEAIGAEKAVMLPIEDGDDEFGWMTEDIVKAHRDYPDTIIPFCHVDVTREDAVTELEKRAASGIFKGYGEQKQHLRLDDPRLEKALAVCNELNWPVTWHFQEGERGYNQGIEHLEVLLKKFPNIKFIGHAQSWWSPYQRRRTRPRRDPVSHGRGQTWRLNRSTIGRLSQYVCRFIRGFGSGRTDARRGLYCGISGAAWKKIDVCHGLPLQGWQRCGPLSRRVFRAIEPAVSQTHARPWRAGGYLAQQCGEDFESVKTRLFYRGMS